MKNIILLFLGGTLLLTACTGTTIAVAPMVTADISMSATPAVPATVTATATSTATITPTNTITSTPTPTWVAQGPDSVTLPILLYHRIGVSPTNNQYYMAPEKFEEQMKLLHDWEYTVIPVALLVKAIEDGAELPPRPVMITFDDGDISVYSEAFPIMQKYGLTGVVYIVGNYMGTEGYMSAEQIKELAAAGWEVGSHSRSHRDLSRLAPEVQRMEIVEARKVLQEATGAPVLSFAYPFGIASTAVYDYVHFAGYVAAMGLGFTPQQGKSNLFWLQRRDIRGDYDIKRFADSLPWQGAREMLPADTATPTPTPSRTLDPTHTLYPTSTTQP